jgi:hypothetical protein
MQQTKQAGKTRPIKKLTRDQIKEGLDQWPVEHLLSAGPGKNPALTNRQKEFARQLTLAPSQAEAYRRSYNTRGTPATQGNHASRLARDSRIQAERAAYELAIETEKHRTPAQLKSLLVQQLVQHTLDQDFPPAQRVQCLKLLGQLFEVGAFVEHKQITTISKSGDIRARILETLKDVTDVQVNDEGMDLLEELRNNVPAGDEGATEAGNWEGQSSGPTTGAPAQCDAAGPASDPHTIPLKQFSENQLDKVPEEDPPMSFEMEEGEGGIKNGSAG